MTNRSFDNARVWRVGADVDTDALAPGAYMKHGLEVIGWHCLEAVRSDFASGVREGDVIVAIANADTSDVKELEAALTKLDKTRPVNVLFRRGEWAQYAVIRPGR